MALDAENMQTRAQNSSTVSREPKVHFWNSLEFLPRKGPGYQKNLALFQPTAEKGLWPLF